MKETDWDILACYGVTPDNLSVGADLYIRDTAITALPDNLSVGGSLYLRDTAITALPDNLSVGGDMYLEGSAITALFKDGRGYRLDRAGNSYIAGCRNFTAEQALAHWGADDYPNKDRGEAFCAAVIAEEKRRKERQ